MLRLAQSAALLRQFKARHFVCLFLALTFLYNPFLAACSFSSGLSVSHLPSFRATVASSELLKFKPLEKLVSLVLSVLDFSRHSYIEAPQENTSFPVFMEPTPRQGLLSFTGNLWFRPPPVV